MKRTEKINIKGFIIHIDEDAYELLKSYLDSLSRHFGKKEEAKEIIDDIEYRVAELFQSRISDQKEVITIEDVKEVIEILGEPVEIDDQEESSDPNETEGTRRLYRDPDDSYIAGIASGIAHYVNADPAWIRAAFIILAIFNGLGVLIYLVLWLVVPPAKTRAQKLEMKGKKVNIENIERSIQNEFDNVKKSFYRFKRSDGYRKTKDGITRFFELLGIIIVALLKVVLVIIGIGLIIAGIGILFGLIGIFTFREWFDFHVFRSVHWDGFSGLFEVGSEISLLYTGIILLIIIPIIVIFYWGIKSAFNLKINDKPLGITLLILWILGFIFLVGAGITEKDTFMFTSGYSSNRFIIDPPDEDTLFIDLKENYDVYEDDRDDLNLIFNYFFVYRNGRKLLYGKPELNIRKTNRKDIELTIRKKSNGKRYEEARYHADNISYSWFQQDSLLLFDNYFIIEDGKKWRIPMTEITLEVPENIFVKADYDINEIAENVEVEDFY